MVVLKFEIDCRAAARCGCEAGFGDIVGEDTNVIFNASRRPRIDSVDIHALINHNTLSGSIESLPGSHVEMVR